VTKTVDVPELAFSIKDFLTPFAGEAEGFGEGSEEFYDLGYVVVVFAIFCAALRVKEVVTRYELEYLLIYQYTPFFSFFNIMQAMGEKYHGCHTPNIGTGTPFCTQNDFRGTVLSCLDVVCEMVARPTCVT
jgi:hypothetical protein